MISMRHTFLGLALLAIATPASAADSQAMIFFKDGRFYEVPELHPKEDHLQVVFKHGTVEVPKILVHDFVGSDGAGVPADVAPEDVDKVEKGLVPFEGKWIKVSQRDRIVDKRRDEKVEQMEEYKKHQVWRDRYQEETKHFRFEFTVPKEVGDDNMAMFEVFFENAKKEWGFKPPRKTKLKVCFYNNMDDFLRIGNVPRGVLGYYRFVEPRELNFFLERNDKLLTLDVLFHELNHYVFDLVCEGDHQLAPWLSEGMAEYYGSSRWDPTTKKMSYGQIQEGRLVHLQDEMDGGEYQDLLGLMREFDINATQYAWSWTLCHMMMEDKKSKSKFKKFVDKLANDKRLNREPNPRNMSMTWVPPEDTIALFQDTFGISDMEAFEKEWYEYIKSLDVQTARGYHQAAMYCRRWARPLRAQIYFKKAIDEYYSDNPRTYYEYARLLVRDDKHKEAVEVLEKGLKLDPMNPYMYKVLGNAYREMGGDSNKEQGKRYQLMAIEMDPNDLDLYRGLDADVLDEVEG